MMEQVTKAELVHLCETDDSLRYFGTFDIAGETRAFYRTAIGAADEPKGFKIVYVVV